MNFAKQVRFSQRVASILLFVSTSCLACTRINAKTIEDRGISQDQSWTLKVTSTAYSSYIGNNDKMFHKGPVQQTTLSIEAPSRLYIGRFESVPFEAIKEQKDYGYEHDYSFGWNGAVHTFTLNPDVTYVNIPPFSQVRGDSLQFSLQVSRPINLSTSSFSPYFWVNHFAPVRGISPQPGTFWRMGLTNSARMGKWGATSALEVLYDTGAFGNKRAWIGKASTEITRTAGSRLEIGIPVRIETPMNHVNDGRRMQCIVGFSIAYDFSRH